MSNKQQASHIPTTTYDRLPILANGPDIFTRHSTELSVPPRTRILRERDFPAQIGWLRTGLVKRTVYVRGQKQRTVSLHSAGYWIGALPAILDLSSLHSVYTVTQCDIVFFTPNEFKSLLREDASLKDDLLMRFCEQLTLSQFKEVANIEEDRINT